MKTVFALLILALATSANAAQPRAWADQHKDVVVINCGDGTLVHSIDPNFCGKATAEGAGGCTELAVFMERVKPVSAGNNKVVLNKRGEVETSIEAKGAGTITYRSIDFMDPRFTKSYELSISNLDAAQLDYMCSMEIDQ